MSTPARSTLDFRAKLRAGVEDYAEAFRDDSWKGGGDPTDIPEIENRLREARLKLTELINKARP
jgi:hypothetical protein